MNISISNAIQSSAISGGGEPSALPLALDLSITGGFAIGSVQTGNYTYFDPNGVAESGTTFKWYRVDGSTRTEVGTAQIYTLVAADEQKAIEFEVTPRNADTLVGPTASVQKNIPQFPVPPTATNVSFTGTLEIGQEMQGSYDYEDLNGEPEAGTTFKWFRANTSGGSGAVEISGATSINYTLVPPADEGKYIQFQVTPRNDIGETGSMSPSSFRGAVDSLPVASNVTYTGNNNVGELLSSSFDYSDANSDPEGTSLYQWLTSATSGGAGTPISGATSANYTVAATDEGNFLSVRVTPVTSSGVQGLRVSSGARAAAVGPLPGFSTNPSFTGILEKGDVLTGTYVYNSASATQGTSTFKWYNSVSGAISGATSLTYTLQASDIGDNISFGVTPVSDTGVQGTEFITPTQGPILDSGLVLDNLEMLLDFTESETLGREEVVNGDFSDGTNDWATSNSTISIEGGALKITSTGGNRPQANQIVNDLVIGRQYKLSAVAKRGTTSNDVEIEISGTASLTTSNRNSTTEYETIFYIFTATATSHTIQAKIDEGVEPSGTTAYFSNVSLKELTQSIPDSSGNNNVAELFTGKALKFDGANDYVNTTGFEMSGTSFTFAFWIYPRATSYQFIMDLDVVGTDQRSILALYNNPAGTLVQKFGWYNNPGGFRQFGDPIQNEWQRVVFRLSPTTVECYVNGVQSGTTQSLATAHNYSNINNSVIGGRNNLGTTQRLDGSLSDFQIYNAYWSTDDIAFDYANPNILVTDSTNTGTSIAVTNLKGYWAMSEGAGSLAYDSSGEGNNGTIIAATYDNSQPRIPQLGMQNWSKGSNLVTYSEDFSAWTNQQIIVIPNATTSPIGSGSATKIIATTVSSTHQINQLSLVASSTCVASIYAKAAGSNTFEVLDGTIAVNGAFFDLATESVTNKGSGIGTIESVGDGWYRCSTVMATTGFRIYQPSSISPISGDGTSGIYIWGAQLEQSSSASAYRLTDGAATLNSTVIPNPTIPTQDIFGNAVRDRDDSFNLDGIGYATIADSTSLNISNGTLQFWLKTTDTAFTILSGQSSSEFIGKANVTWFNNNAGTITVYKDNVTSSSNNTPDTDGNWHFYTFTGINVSSWTAFEISNLANFKLDGLLDSVFIYSDVLTSAEIIKNYNFTEPDHQ